MQRANFGPLFEKLFNLLSAGSLYVLFCSPGLNQDQKQLSETAEKRTDRETMEKNRKNGNAGAPVAK